MISANVSSDRHAQTALALALLLVLGMSSLRADDKPKAPEKQKPKIVLAMPLGITAAAPAKIILRGARLDDATEVRFQNTAATAKILSKGKATIPDKLAAME